MKRNSNKLEWKKQSFGKSIAQQQTNDSLWPKRMFRHIWLKILLKKRKKITQICLNGFI